MERDGRTLSAVKRDTRNRALAAVLDGLSRVVRLLSFPAAQKLGSGLGRLSWLILPRQRRLALGSIRTAFPDWSERLRVELARSCFIHLGKCLTEIAWSPNLSRDNLDSVVRWEGLDHLHHALEQKRGVVLFSGHCGNWELFAAAFGALGQPFSVIAREIEESRFNDYIVQSRARFGVHTIGRGSSSSARDILRALRSGIPLGVLIDQSIKGEIVRVPFFGHDAPTPAGPARIAVKTGAMALAFFIERLPDGTHLVRFHEPIDTRRMDDPKELTWRMTEAIEAQIRRAPAQWVWMHRRWRERAGQKES